MSVVSVDTTDDISSSRRRTMKQQRRRDAVIVHTGRVSVVVGVLVLWQVATTHSWIKPVLAETPAEVWRYLVRAGGSGELWRHTQATLSAVLLAFGLASVVGVVVGVGLGLLPRTERVLGPFLDAINAMPRIALAPVFIIYFGVTIWAKVALAFSVVVFMVLSAARAGVRSADSETLRLSTILGATKPQLFVKVLLPVAVPSIFAALRLGLIYSLLGVVASEIIASRQGLGQLVAHFSGVFQLDGVYGVLILLAVIATTLNQLMVVIERRMLRWQPPVDR